MWGGLCGCLFPGEIIDPKMVHGGRSLFGRRGLRGTAGQRGGRASLPEQEAK